MTAMERLFELLILGLATCGLAAIVRSLPWPKPWKKRKPLDCSTCVSGWSSVFLILALMIGGHFPLCDTMSEWVRLFEIWMAATGMSVWLLAHTSLFVNLEAELDALKEGIPEENRRQ